MVVCVIMLGRPADVLKDVASLNDVKVCRATMGSSGLIVCVGNWELPPISLEFCVLKWRSRVCVELQITGCSQVGLAGCRRLDDMMVG